MRKFLLPIILLRSDKTIDARTEGGIITPGIFVARGRTLTIANFATDSLGAFSFKRFFMVVRGNIRFAREAKEMSVDEIRYKLAHASDLYSASRQANACFCEFDWSGLPGEKPECQIHIKVEDIIEQKNT